MAKQKRLVVISDLHCGHAVGLTPPAWQWAVDGDTTEHRAKFGRVQREVWDWYSQTIGSLRPIDILAVNGDAIDGTGVRSGGTELLTTDRQVQTDMAVKSIQEASAKTIVMTYGTAYHTGDAEDWEDRVAEHV